jgi:predicted amidohydrolase YtcJ
VPGFIDSHLHSWRGNISKRGVKTLEFETMEEGLGQIAEEMPKHPKGKWVVFDAIRNANTLSKITRWDLDKVAPDHPIRLSLDTALSVVNTKGWEAIKAKVDGLPGVIYDKQRKEPNGHIRGQANGGLLYEDILWPEDWETTLVEQEKKRMKMLNSQGLTMDIGRAQGLTVSILNNLWKKGELTLRARPSLEFVMYNPQAEEYLKRLGNLDGFGDDMLKIVGMTVGPPDGTGGTGGILTRLEKKRALNIKGGDAWDALGMPGENKWQLGVDGADFTKGTDFETIILANRYGWTITSIHAQGDLAAKIILDAFEAANKERPIKGRNFSFDHGLVRTEEDIKRAVDLGVIMSFAPKYVFSRSPEDLIWQFGENVHRMTPIKTAMNLGMKPVIEADLGGYRSHSLWLIQAAVTRTDENGRVWGAKEAISREDALRMRTAWSARYARDEEKLGTIEEGKLADLVVLSGDYMAVPANEIAKLKVDYTVVGGKIVYDRAVDGEIKMEETFSGFAEGN